MQIVEFQLDNGTTVLAEVSELDEEGSIERIGRGDAVVYKARQTLGVALSVVRPAAESIISQLQDLAQPIEEVQVEFGVKLNASVGALLASAAGESHYQVTITWKPRPK